MDQLKHDIASKTEALQKMAGVKQVNVLLVGEISAGKSSYINSVESAFHGEILAPANAALRDSSTTTKVRKM